MLICRDIYCRRQEKAIGGTKTAIKGSLDTARDAEIFNRINDLGKSRKGRRGREKVKKAEEAP